jgi:hypothetical protein
LRSGTSRGVSMSQPNRSIKNFVINPAFQFRMAFYFVSAAVAVTGLLLFVIYGYLAEIRTIVANSPGLAIATQLELNDVVSKIIQISIGFLVVMVTAILGYAVVVSHRIAGPMFAILAFVEQMKKGNYQAQRPLRPYDELGPIMVSLHDLANQLSDQKGRS